MEPAPAASIIVARPAAAGDDAYELYLLRRHSKSGFMANAYVFPGGRLDEADCAPEVRARCAGLTPEEAAAVLGDETPDRAFGLHVAAVRESFEEAGVLLADDASGAPVRLDDPAFAARYAQARVDVASGARSFAGFLGDEGLTLRLDRLAYWSYWITPRIERRRYAARFFLALVPEGQRPAHDERETTASAWRAPACWLERHRAGEVQLAPPQVRMMIDFARTPRWADVQAQAKGRRALPPILPEPKLVDGALHLLLPGDREYPGAERAGGPLHRAVIRDGRWNLVE